MPALNNLLPKGSLQWNSSDVALDSDGTGIESGVPLQTVPRPSTETTRRNGFRQSVAPDRATRMMEDIINRKCVLKRIVLSSSKIIVLT